MTGFLAPLIVASGAVQVRTTPSRRAVAVSADGATGTSSGTMETRFERSLFADSPSVTTAYVTRTGRPSAVWSGGVSSYVRRAPAVAAGNLAPSMPSTRVRTFRNLTGINAGTFAKSWMGDSGLPVDGAAGGSSTERQTATRLMPVMLLPAVVRDG